MRPGDSHLKSPVSFAASNEQQSPLVVERLPNNPIIRAEMLPAGDGDNINGASLIGTPVWLPGRLGNYYLYFAHHRGTYIRLAYAQQLEGPWTIHRPGTLKLTDAHACRGHIASPDVHVDEKRRQIRMYFHGPSRIEPGQKSYLALSTDGLNFVARDAILGPFYFRVVRWRDRWIAMAKGGQVYVSNDGLSNFRCASVQPFFLRDPRGNDPGDVRHVAVHPRGDGLIVYFTHWFPMQERGRAMSGFIPADSIEPAMRSDAERNREMRFPRADRPSENEILGGGDPFAPGQGVHLGGVDAVGRGEVKGVERLHLGKAGLAQALADDRLVARRLLGAEDLVQIVLVGPVAIARLPGESFKRAGHTGQLQRSRVGDDEIPDHRWGAHAPTSTSQPS
jgi:hypothetical protein